MPRSAAVAEVMPDRGDLGVAVGDPRHAVVVDRASRAARPSRSATRMPSAKPTCASCRPGVRSPTAEIVGTLVWQYSSTFTKPRSTVDAGFLVAEARPRPGRGRRRPAAARPRAWSPPSRVTVTPDAGVLDALEPGAELVADAAAPERALQQLRAGLVLGRHQVRQHLDDRDLGAERPPHAGELDADHAAAQDDRRRGHVVQRRARGRW